MTSRSGSGEFKPFTLENSDLSEHEARTNDIARARVALDAGRMGSWVHYIPKNEIWADQIVADLLQLDMADLPWTADDFFKTLQRIGHKNSILFRICT